MSFLDKIIGADSRATIGEITLDASVREVHELNGIVTEHPVEEGIDVTDHYRVEPRTLIIEGKISNTPLSTGFPLETAISAIGAIINQDEQPSTNAFKEFERYFDDSVIISIKTSLKNYESVVLTSLSVDRSNKNADSLDFSATAREIKIVKTRLAAALELAKKAAAQKTASKGKQATKAAPAGGGTEQQSSALVKLGKSVGFF